MVSVETAGHLGGEICGLDRYTHATPGHDEKVRALFDVSAEFRRVFADFSGSKIDFRR